MILSESVEYVGEYPFCDCPDLRTVLFRNAKCEIPARSSTVSNKKTGGSKDFYRGIIYGEKGSTAQTFAKKMGFRFEDTEEFERRQEQERIRQLMYGGRDAEADDVSEPETTAAASGTTDQNGTETDETGASAEKSSKTAAKADAAENRE